MEKRDGLVSLDELCALLKVSKSYIYKLTSQNMIPYYKVGGLKFKLTEVEIWLQQNKVNAGKPISVDRFLK